MLLFRLSGQLLLRFAERQLLALWFQLPPRFTRFDTEVLSHPSHGGTGSVPSVFAVRTEADPPCVEPTVLWRDDLRVVRPPGRHGGRPSRACRHTHPIS
jgi:hypothetical protein